jgi:hypothetical protein
MRTGRPAGSRRGARRARCGSRRSHQAAETGANGSYRLARGRRVVAVTPTRRTMVAFESKHSPLKYATDVFDHWHANLRAIALGLEALRKVERYGITQRGEQYTGFRALGSGIAMPAAQMTAEDAAAFLIAQGGITGEGGEGSYVPGDLLNGLLAAERRAQCYRRAAQRLHPDAGGSTADFQRLQEAKRVVDGAPS